MSAFISAGDFQLFVKPASFSSSEQMKVRSSTRATSLGSEAAWKLFGFLSGLSRVKVPASTSRGRQLVPLLVGPVDPVDRVRGGERGDLVDPGLQACVTRACRVLRLRGHGGPSAGLAQLVGHPPDGPVETARDGGSAPAVGSLVSTVGPCTEGEPPRKRLRLMRLLTSGVAALEDLAGTPEVLVIGCSACGCGPDAVRGCRGACRHPRPRRAACRDFSRRRGSGSLLSRCARA